jgi:cardiolipin synthase
VTLPLIPAADLPSFETGYYVAEWIIRIAMLFVVPMRRDPAATRGWLLLIFFLPVPGLLLFLLIGRPRFPKWRAERFHQLVPMFSELSDRLGETVQPDTCNGPIATLGKTLGRFPATGGNHVELIDDYDAVIARLITDIDGARHHVRILAYIFADDATGQTVIDALARAVARGVPCHVLVDPVGAHHWMRSVLRKLAAAGVEARATLPFHVLRDRTRRDMRNHRKLFLIDGAIGYAGSQNIVGKDFKPGIVNRELVARAEGPVVAEMAAIFLADWYLETRAMLDAQPAIPEARGEAIAQLLPSGADYPLEGFETLLVWQIHQARERVTITTPYLIPDEDLIGAMRTAVARGVTVDLIVSAIADQMLVSLAQRSYYEELLHAGVRIHAFRDFLLHAKNVSIDGRLAIIGSSNVDIRSFQLNEEVSLMLLDDASVAALEAVQRGYVEHSDTMDLAAWKRRSIFAKLAENVARLVSPLL